MKPVKKNLFKATVHFVFKQDGTLYRYIKYINPASPLTITASICAFITYQRKDRRLRYSGPELQTEQINV